MKSVCLEFYKLRRKHIFLMSLAFLTVEMLWAFTATQIAVSRNPQHGGWMPLLMTLASMNALFLPILSAICVSRICDMEHKGNTWKLLLSLSVQRGRLYGAKYICAFIIMLGACVLQVLAVMAFGIVSGFEQLPLWVLLQFLLGVVLANMAVIALQQWVSMAIKNQAFALSLGMIGGFIGMAADLFPVAVRRFFLWSYYTGISPVTQSYTDEGIHFVVRSSGELFPVALLTITVGIILYAAGSIHVSRQEV
ncbi:ABC transporter permease [uncultured Paenibacillus sp.]|uniref:ABC transporter permease n=1 Tax=uncultured Paenibacillus sp. TaxID=227322 RepID=UPI0015A925A2|nr:ABC transporter permease [uncultured Paenibacillus sp.]